MRKNLLFIGIVLLLIMNIGLIQNVRGMTMVSEHFVFSGFGGWTLYSVSSAPVRHHLSLYGLNGSVTVYVLNGPFTPGSPPTEYLYTFTGSDINEVMTIGAPVVSIVVFSSAYVSGSIMWDVDIGFPDEGWAVLIWIIVLLSLGISLFIVYRIIRWRKLKE